MFQCKIITVPKPPPQIKCVSHARVSLIRIVLIYNTCRSLIDCLIVCALWLWYAQGTRATMLLMNGLIGDFNFAAKLKGQENLVSTLFCMNLTQAIRFKEISDSIYPTAKPTPVRLCVFFQRLVSRF